MWKEFKYAKSRKNVAINLEKVALVKSSSDGNAVLFLDGDSDGVEISVSYDDFIARELGIEE